MTYRQRHIALKFLYNGIPYTGLAENVGSESDNSIEKHLFAALTKSCLITSRESANYSRCGRTDKGVSAFGQVIALCVKSAVPVNAMMEQSANDDGDDDVEVTEVTVKDENETVTKKMKCVQDVDLPRNSVNAISYFVPPKQKKKKKQNNTQESSSSSSSSPPPPTSTTMTLLQPKTITELNYPQMLNNLLPPSIRVVGWSPVSTEFSARFSCSHRIYRYYFVRSNLNLDDMYRAAKLMEGDHDFRNFCKMNCEQVYNFRRKMHQLRIVRSDGVEHVPKEEEEEEGGGGGDDSKMTEEQDGDTENVIAASTNNNDSSSNNPRRQLYHVEIVGQAFLWHQIRCIMSILFLVGQQLEPPSIITTLLDVKSNPGKPSYEMASDKPLVLHDCQYTNVTFGHHVENMWKVQCDLEQQLEEYSIMAERTRDGIDSLQSSVVVFYKDVYTFVKRIIEERKKKKRRYNEFKIQTPPTTELSKEEEEEERYDGGGGTTANETMSWKEALQFIQKHLSLMPSSTNHKEHIHVPLMKRCKSTTYEEKVEGILQEGSSSKRRQRYEENIIKKRKAAEYDRNFYMQKLQEGGSGL